MFRLAVLLLFAAIMPSQAIADECYKDEIIQISGRGSIIKTMYGHIFQVDDYDTYKTTIWLSVTRIVYCRDYGDHFKIIRTEDNDDANEYVRATLLR